MDLSGLPQLEIPGHFVSQHGNVADYAIHSVSSILSRRTYESRLRAVAHILGYESARDRFAAEIYLHYYQRNPARLLPRKATIIGDAV